MRSRHWTPPQANYRNGITSACAEQTDAACAQGYCDWDHLRVCGADYGPNGDVSRILGSPPRVRSRRHRLAYGVGWHGITSACAEQTRPRNRPTTRRRDHLRVCGADSDNSSTTTSKSGSPPRVRSRRKHFRAQRGHIVDHLRVCGADGMHPIGMLYALGSPPRVRSRPCRFIA